MIKLLDLLNENSTSKYNYGCVMLFFDIPQIFKMQDAVEPEEWYTQEGDKTYGTEDEFHVTLLYGLHEDVTLNQVKDIINKFTFNKEITLNNVSLFKKDEYEVLKFDAVGDTLTQINSELTKLPHTNDYPDYHPHMTIGYMKPGMGDQYVKGFKNIKLVASPSHVVYSMPNGEKHKIKINV